MKDVKRIFEDIIDICDERLDINDSGGPNEFMEIDTLVREAMRLIGLEDKRWS